jgi:N-acetylglucosaminyldiphosphoundecaprenol N-acetyl-beta-D-mannosaminyltransferase
MKNFEEITVLNTRFHKITVCQLIEYLVSAAQIDKKTIVGNVNVKAMNLAYEQPWYKKFLNDSDLVFCDGFGVLLAAKQLGYSVKSVHRMTCPDYIENLALACERADISLFLLAGKPGVVDKAIEKLKYVTPKLRVQGHHGHFKKSGQENELILQQINQFMPGILYVGFGMPLQESWILDNIDRLDTRVILPLGACLDFYTNTIYRGPRWMTDLGLEWLIRFVTEPQRLWERYVIGNPLFFYRVIKQRIFQSKIS